MPREDALLVVDTNVVSGLHSVAKRGFDLERPSDCRVAHLLRWLESHPSAAVSSAFGVIEGAGFHRGGLSYFGIVQRAYYVLATLEYGRQHADEWVRSGKPLPDVPIPEDAVHPRAAIAIAEALLPWTVLPSYVATLAAGLADREGKAPLDAAYSVHRRLEAELDFIPVFAWVAAAALFLGEAELRRELRQALFKLPAPDIRRACLSAAWDLGYLQLLSIARAPAASQLFEGRLPVLVTEDRQLAPTALLGLCLGNSPFFELPAEMFDLTWREEAVELLQKRQLARLQIPGRPPDWDGCADAAALLEEELEIEDAPRLSLHRMTAVLQPSREEVLAFLSLLRAPDLASLESAHLTDLEQEVEPAGFLAVGRLIQDNANAHERSVAATWEAIGLQLPADWERVVPFALVVKMTKAAIARDWQMFNAWGEKLVIDGKDGWIAIGLWRLGRAVLGDTSAVRGEPLETLLDRLAQRVEDGWA